MLIGLLLFAIISCIGAFAYRQSKLEQHVIKHISLIDWINILLLPFVAYVGTVFVVVSILQRPGVTLLDFDDVTLFVVGLPLLIYTFVGNSIHFVSKVLSRHMRPDRSVVYRINEIFHGKLSHYFTWVCMFLTLFVIAMLEFNHPLLSPMSRALRASVVVSGVLFGIAVSRSMFYTSDWWGGNRSMFIFVSSYWVIVFSMFQVLDLSFGYHPFGLFIVSTAATTSVLFVLRRVFVLFRLTGKRRLRLLTKLMLLRQ